MVMLNVSRLAMMNLIYTGRGWVVPASAFGLSLIAEIITRSLTGDESYYQTHGGPLALALLLSACVTYVAFQSLYRPSFNSDGLPIPAPAPKWIDHSFMFVNMRIWAPLFVIISFGLVGFRGL